ncbi:hypothetical protein FK220_000800 [Flavobacteriaceae bacterium TP-CH-4]|uniref:Uncharacterized protein n=1 Tax=Pelagihabitans pacificus TaxID=2696054 RepID=A0A967E5A2_9FLAO|nr:hypothetical protein [Pelagihabitans pacificus]NHF57859.1 hypothetical protein [Pelagihabitans pacificus]
MIYVETDCVIEGEALLPELIVELRDIYPDRIPICFVACSDVTVDKKFEDIKKFSRKKKDWLLSKSSEYIRDHVNNMIAHSKSLRESCKEHDISYFDTSKNFMETIEEATAYMLVTA